MKKLFVVSALVLSSLMSYGQSPLIEGTFIPKEAVKAIASTIKNPVQIKYIKDEFTGKERIEASTDFLITDESGEGIILYPGFKKVDGKWEYAYLGGKSTVGTCFEKDKVYFIFDDDSKFEMTSWRDFNCKGALGFDLYGAFRSELSKSIKAVKFVNGRGYESFQKTITNKNDKEYFINVFKALDAYNSKN